MDTLHARLRHTRRMKDLTQSELATKAGISRATIAMLETLPNREVRSDTLTKLACALEVSTDFLLLGSDAVPHA